MTTVADGYLKILMQEFRSMRLTEKSPHSEPWWNRMVSQHYRGKHQQLIPKKTYFVGFLMFDSSTARHCLVVSACPTISLFQKSWNKTCGVYFVLCFLLHPIMWSNIYGIGTNTYVTLGFHESRPIGVSQALSLYRSQALSQYRPENICGRFYHLHASSDSLCSIRLVW